ncbi:MAG: hypothetical protein R3E50_10800 [Halioglobus sp.]
MLAQLPNFHRLLKKNNIDFELLTAGEYKRTLTMFGEAGQGRVGKSLSRSWRRPTTCSRVS